MTRTAPATALVDGDNGMGHLVVSRAMETAIDIAKENGVGWVGMRMSNHAGAAGVYAALPLKADMIGLYAAVANANHMPLAGGSEPLLGTNPFAIAIPAGQEPPLVLDIATSIVSYGTIKNHRLQNIPLAPGWMVDPKTGEAVIDPKKSAEALLLPMAGYKGAGLALMFGLLAGTLNGALFGRDCVDFNATPEKVNNTGQFVIALDPARFQPLDQFKAEVDRHSRELRASKTLPGQSVRLPGEQRAKRRADRLANGLALAPELLVELDKLAKELGNQAAARARLTGLLLRAICYRRVRSRGHWRLAVMVKRAFAALFAVTIAAAVVPPAAAQDYGAIVAAPDRSDADRNTDKRRDPVKLLNFTGVKEGMKVLDMEAGAGYTTELLARAVGPNGVVYAQDSAEVIERQVKDKFDLRARKACDERRHPCHSQLRRPVTAGGTRPRFDHVLFRLS